MAEEKRKQQQERAKVAALRAKEEEQRKVEEAEKRAEEKAVRDAKKKVEQDKREAERKRVDKKEAEKLKKAEEKAAKDAQKLAEKAEAEKEANRKRAEQQSEKQRLDNEEEIRQKEQEAKQVALERDRLKRAEALEKMEWPAVVQLAKDESEKPDVAKLLVVANKLDGEERVDAILASLGSFFILGVRPDKDSPVLSSTLRNRVKKVRTRLRTSAAAGEFASSLPDVRGDKAALDQILARVVNGVLDEPEAAVEEQKADEPAPVQQAAGKKKGKAKGKQEEEDLDSLLKEFGVTASSKSKKKKKA